MPGHLAVVVPALMQAVPSREVLLSPPPYSACSSYTVSQLILLLAIRSTLDIDPAFIESHAGRRRYQPLRWRKEARFLCYKYPEIVRGHEAVLRPRRGGQGGTRKDGSGAGVGLGDGSGSEVGSGKVKTRDAVDLLGDPEIRSISEEDGGLAAVFCHASLWVTARADVLFLDRPLWRDPASPLRKAKRQSSVTKPYTMQNGSTLSEESGATLDVKLADGDEIASLEDMLQEMLKDASDTGDELMHILSGSSLQSLARAVRVSDAAVAPNPVRDDGLLLVHASVLGTQRGCGCLPKPSGQASILASHERLDRLAEQSTCPDQPSPSGTEKANRPIYSHIQD